MKKTLLLFITLFNIFSLKAQITSTGTLNPVPVTAAPFEITIVYSDSTSTITSSVYIDGMGVFSDTLNTIIIGTAVASFVDCGGNVVSYTATYYPASAIGPGYYDFGTLAYCSGSGSSVSTVVGQFTNTNGPITIQLSYDNGITYQSVSTDSLGYLYDTLNALTSSGVVNAYFYNCNNDTILLTASNISSSPSNEYFSFGNIDYCPVACSANFSLSQNLSTNPNGTTTATGVTLVINASTGSNLTYSWDFGDGSALYTGVNFTHTYANSGPYSLCLTVDNGVGCTDTFCDSLVIDSNGVLIGKTNQEFTIQMGDGSDETNTVSSTQNLESKIAIELFPNPAKENINIALNAQINEKASLKIYDITGKLVKSEKINISEGKQNISVSLITFVKGLYVLKIKTNQGMLSSKIIKK